VAVSEADRRRLAEVEAGLRALAPQMRAIARDAVDIAYTAIGRPSWRALYAAEGLTEWA